MVGRVPAAKVATLADKTRLRVRAAGLTKRSRSSRSPMPPLVSAASSPAAAAVPDRDILTAWAMNELFQWRSKPVSLTYAEESYQALNEKRRDIFIYRFAKGEVHQAPKSRELDHLASLVRAEKYLAFFREVARRLPPDFESSIAMDVEDKVEFVPDVPIFCFQKRRDNNTILVPDIDFLALNFYEGKEFVDSISYEDKIDKAIFVGGTTGGMMTPEVVRNCSLPRLRAARFFQGHDRVEFLLPKICQTTDAEAHALLEQMPFCKPERISWKEQLRRRFLISIDGNGATCSRVVIALRSNSVLLKYNSEDLLYYFSGLSPWQHYIPVACDADVERCFDLEEWSPGVLQRVARQGREFANRFLTREAVTDYMLQLLLLYQACFVGTADRNKTAVVEVDAEPIGKPSSSTEGIFLIAHIEGVGDTAAQDDGWVGHLSGPGRIEGFWMSCGAPGWQRHVIYQAVLMDQALGQRVEGGTFCGTRGKRQPIHGFVLHVAAEALHLGGLVYEGVFQDGFWSGPLRPGTLCRSPTNAALVAMRVMVAAAVQS
jgi:hypothetical protein